MPLNKLEIIRNDVGLRTNTLELNEEGRVTFCFDALTPATVSVYWQATIAKNAINQLTLKIQAQAVESKKFLGSQTNSLFVSGLEPVRQPLQAPGNDAVRRDLAHVFCPVLVVLEAVRTILTGGKA